MVVNGESSAGKVASQLLTSQIVNRLMSAIPGTIYQTSGTFSTAIGKTIPDWIEHLLFREQIHSQKVGLFNQ